jgi:hypothetical protein
MIDPTRVLNGLPKRLRDELLKTYQDIAKNFAEHRWEPSELNGGKFCEVVYSIVQGALTGSFPAKASKPKNMVDACQGLQKLTPHSRVGDRSLRILIPRMLPVLYEIRNNRGVGHVGGDVDPNFMDASAVYGMASWLLAELVRIFHGATTEEAQETVDALVERKTPLIWEVEDVKRVLNPKMKVKDQTLLLLHQRTAWVNESDLLKWTEYSNPSVYRKEVLGALHKSRLIEFDKMKSRARISPLSSKRVEEQIIREP